MDPIRFHRDGTNVTIKTARGRANDRVLHKHSRVSRAIADPEGPTRYLDLRGQVIEETEEGAFELICRLNGKHNGTRDFGKRSGEVRVTYKILPEQVSIST